VQGADQTARVIVGGEEGLDDGVGKGWRDPLPADAIGGNGLSPVLGPGPPEAIAAGLAASMDRCMAAMRSLSYLVSWR